MVVHRRLGWGGGGGVLGWCNLGNTQIQSGREFRGRGAEEKKGYMYIIGGCGVVRVEHGQRAPCMWISVASSFMSAFLGGNPICGP